MVHKGWSARRGFTLVELLVVIGIIALLISVLLPALNKARAAAQTVACLSNVRQMVIAATLFSHDHQGYMQTCTSDGPPGSSANAMIVRQDPSRRKFIYRSDNNELLDVYSALLPYMGARNGVTFQTDPDNKSRVFRCPSDHWLDFSVPGQNGYNIGNNVTAVSGSGRYFPISYGCNADILCVSDSGGVGHCGLSDNVAVVDGPPPFQGNTGPNNRRMGQPLQAKLQKVRRASETLLFADCGTRPQDPSLNQSTPLDWNDALFYTSNYQFNQGGMTAGDAGRLSGVYTTSWLKDRFPFDRHSGKKVGSTYADPKINVGFCDGHAETVLLGEFKGVRVSPY